MGQEESLSGPESFSPPVTQDSKDHSWKVTRPRPLCHSCETCGLERKRSGSVIWWVYREFPGSRWSVFEPVCPDDQA